MLKKLIIILYIALLFVMAAATLVEKANSTDYAHEHIYGAWWFVALWAALAIAGAIYFIMYARRVTGTGSVDPKLGSGLSLRPN